MKKLASLFAVMAISVFAIGCGDAETETPDEGTPAASSTDAGDGGEAAEGGESAEGGEAEAGSGEGN